MKDYNDLPPKDKKDNFSVFPEFEDKPSRTQKKEDIFGLGSENHSNSNDENNLKFSNNNYKNSNDNYNHNDNYYNDNNNNLRFRDNYNNSRDSGKEYANELYARGGNKPKNSSKKFVNVFIAIFSAVVLFVSGFLSAYLLVPSEEEKLTRWIKSTIDENFYDGTDQNFDFTEIIGDAMVGKTDQFSSFYSPKDVEVLNNENQGQFNDSGLIFYDYHSYVANEYQADIGQEGLTVLQKEAININYSAQLLKPNFVFALKVYRNSPAYDAGIRKGYKLIKVGTTSALGLSIGEVNALLDEQRKSDTGFNLTFVRSDLTTLVVANLKAAEYEPNFSYYFDSSVLTSDAKEDMSFAGLQHLLSSKTAYISFEEFSAGANEQFKNNLIRFKQSGKTNLILDLRTNFGGSLAILQRVASMLITDQAENSINLPITVAKYKNGSQTIYTDAVVGETYADFGIKKIIVLADSFSASASELLIGALSDYETVTSLIGKRTYGKAVMQQFFGYKDYGMYLTTAVLFSAVKDNFTYNKKGFTPDVNISYNFQTSKKDDDQLLRAAELFDDAVEINS